MIVIAVTAGLCRGLEEALPRLIGVLEVCCRWSALWQCYSTSLMGEEYRPELGLAPEMTIPSMETRDGEQRNAIDHCHDAPRVDPAADGKPVPISLQEKMSVVIQPFGSTDPDAKAVQAPT